MAVLGSTSLTGCNSIPDFIATSSLMLFQQTTAPTNWTKQTTHDNKALRVVSGTATPGGSTAFTSVFASRTPAGSVSGTVSVSGGSVGNTTLSTPQIPSHNHTDGSAGSSAASADPSHGSVGSAVPSPTGETGGGGSHTHPFTVGSASLSASFTGSAQDFAVSYVDLIICAKN